MSSERYYLVVVVNRLSGHWRVRPSRVASGYCCTDVMTDRDKFRLTSNPPSFLPSLLYPAARILSHAITLLVPTEEVVSNSDPYKNYSKNFVFFLSLPTTFLVRIINLAAKGISSISFPSIASYRGADKSLARPD